MADSHENHDNHDHHNHSDHVSSTLTANLSSSPTTNRTEAYIFGTISVLIVSLLSLVGAGMLPFVNNKSLYRGAIVLFMSLAVGTMTSDAMLHLIPECLGVHDHDSGEHHGHDHEEKNEKAYIGVMCAVLASLYLLYLFEIVSIIASKHCKSFATVADIAAHGHSHGSQQATQDNNQICIEMKPPNKPSSPSSAPLPSSPSSSSVSRPQNLICGLKPVAFIVLFGDGLHNFCDGLAIGAAFMASSASGLATSIAVVCHELPHEIGDFAILINSGLSFKKALLLNLLSALTAFAGLYVGIEAGSLDGFRKWIFAVVAGGFLYVGLVHMLHEIKDSATSLTWYAGAALQNIGLIVGFVIVLLLAIFEDELGG